MRKICEKCKSNHDGSYASGRFCSAYCARSTAALTNKKDADKKRSESVKRWAAENRKCQYDVFDCMICGKKFTARIDVPKRKMACGKDCGHIWRVDERNPNCIVKRLKTTTKVKYIKLTDIFHELECHVCKEKFRISEATLRVKTTQTCSRKCSQTWPYHHDNPNHLHNLQRASMAGRKSVYLQGDLRRSKNEIHFANMCKEKFKTVLCNEPMFEKWDADVILPDQKIAILWNGVWHNRKLFEGHNLKQVKSRDKLKLNAISRCGYQAYTINDPGKENIEFVKEQFEKFVEWTS